MFKVEPLRATFGAKIHDIKLAQISNDDFDALYQLWLEYALLIFPGQNLSHAQQRVFAQRFGDLEFALTPLSNVRKNGSALDMDHDLIKILKGNMQWHIDSTYMPVQAKAAVFCAEIVPTTGGDTEWADMRAAYETLDPETKKRISKLSAYHSLAYSQKKMGQLHKQDGTYNGYGLTDQAAPLRPLVKIHPETGCPALTIGRHAHDIPGMKAEASEQLLSSLLYNACQAPRTYRHSWNAGDAVIWDNRCLMHRGMDWDMRQPRTMFHARIAGDSVTEFAPSPQQHN
ncbi:MAG: TauD/TfdA family dioxygenase [Pseudomonadales bacterium]|nr:TauD/TfdA family dioxygenase [Pseudomonadales bacterium]